MMTKDVLVCFFSIVVLIASVIVVYFKLKCRGVKDDKNETN